MMNILDLLNDLQIDHREEGHHHCRSGWVQLKHCPFCGSDNYHLGICSYSFHVSCWRCGRHSLWDLFRELSLPKEAYFRFKEERSLLAPSPAPSGTFRPPEGVGPLLRAHRDYLRSRGFDPDSLVAQWGLQGIGIASRLAWRIYIPITRQEKLVSWTTRAIGATAEPRYISASAQEESWPHKHLLYGMDYCRSSVVVVEGPVDAWAVGPGAVALFGTAYSLSQVSLLSRFARRYICLDSTIEGQRSARALAAALAPFAGCTTSIALDAKDPGSAPAKELQRLRRIAGLSR